MNWRFISKNWDNYYQKKAIKRFAMKNCQKFRSMFTDVLYGELSLDQKDQFNHHLKSCSKCAVGFAQMKSVTEAMDNRTRTEPDDFYWEGYWDNLVDRMEKEEKQVSRSILWWQRFKETFSLEPRLVYRFAGVVALLFIGILIGKFYFSGTEKLKFHSHVFEQNTNLSAQQIALQNRVNRYFDRSKVLLLGMINFDPETEDVFALNLPYRKVISQKLVHEAVALKGEMHDPAYDQLKRLISDLEMILLQIANLESELDIEGIELVKSGVDRKGIMLKINLEAMQEPDEGNKLYKIEKKRIIM